MPTSSGSSSRRLTLDEGGIPERRMHDDNTHELLAQILFEIKKINVHLCSITDESVSESDAD